MIILRIDYNIRILPTVSKHIIKGQDIWSEWLVKGDKRKSFRWMDLDIVEKWKTMIQKSKNYTDLQCQDIV